MPTAISGGGTWTLPAACQFSGSNGLTLIAYNSNTSAASTLTINAGTFHSARITYYEYTYSGGTPTFDACAAGGSTAAGGAFPGLALSGLSGSDVVINSIGNANNIILSSVGAPFGNFLANGVATWVGTADHLNTNNGAGASFPYSTNYGPGMAVSLALHL